METNMDFATHNNYKESEIKQSEQNMETCIKAETSKYEDWKNSDEHDHFLSRKSSKEIYPDRSYSSSNLDESFVHLADTDIPSESIKQEYCFDDSGVTNIKKEILSDEDMDNLGGNDESEINYDHIAKNIKKELTGNEYMDDDYVNGNNDKSVSQDKSASTSKNVGNFQYIEVGCVVNKEGTPNFDNVSDIDYNVTQNNFDIEHVKKEVTSDENTDGESCGDMFKQNIKTEVTGSYGINIENSLPEPSNNDDIDEEIEKPFACTFCGKRFRIKNGLELHVNNHTRPFPCDKCDRRFPSKYKLDDHLRWHNKEFVEHCTICDMGFVTKAGYKSHLFSHTGLKPFTCDECSKCFSSKFSLKIHKRIHSGEKPHKCEQCGKCFTQKSQLNVHERYHTGIHPYKCQVCDMEFKRSTAYNAHVKGHTSGENPLQCKVCGRLTDNKSRLVIHMRTHTREKPHTCEFCDKSFSEKSALRLHTRIHTGERPVHCSDCNMTFRTHSALHSHRKVHIGETFQTFECPTCKKTFRQVSSLARHQKRKHEVIIKSEIKNEYCDESSVNITFEENGEHHSFDQANNDHDVQDDVHVKQESS